MRRSCNGDASLLSLQESKKYYNRFHKSVTYHLAALFLFIKGSCMGNNQFWFDLKLRTQILSQIGTSRQRGLPKAYFRYFAVFLFWSTRSRDSQNIQEAKKFWIVFIDSSIFDSKLLFVTSTQLDLMHLGTSAPIFRY